MSQYFAAKCCPRPEPPAFHDGGSWPLHRLRLQITLFDAVVSAVVIELLLARPQPLDQAQPLLRGVIARVMLEHLGAEHVDLGLVPTRHQVEREAPAGDVVDHRPLLGRHQRMVDRDMRGRHHPRPSRSRRQCLPPRYRSRSPALADCPPHRSRANAPPGRSPRNPSRRPAAPSARVFGQLMRNRSGSDDMTQPPSRLVWKRAELERAIAENGIEAGSVCVRHGSPRLVLLRQHSGIARTLSSQ